MAGVGCGLSNIAERDVSARVNETRGNRRCGALCRNRCECAMASQHRRQRSSFPSQGKPPLQRPSVDGGLRDISEGLVGENPVKLIPLTETDEVAPVAPIEADEPFAAKRPVDSDWSHQERRCAEDGNIAESIVDRTLIGITDKHPGDTKLVLTPSTPTDAAAPVRLRWRQRQAFISSPISTPPLVAVTLPVLLAFEKISEPNAPARTSPQRGPPRHSQATLTF